MRLDWQNLNEHGSGWREGRAWLRLWPSARGYPSNATVRFEWSHFKRLTFSLKVTLAGGDGDDLGLHIALFGISWWLTFQGFLPYGWLPRDRYLWGIETGFDLSGDFLRLYLFYGDANSMGKDRGWYRCAHLLDLLLGRAKYQAGAPEVTSVLIPMPERAYRATVSLQNDSWKSPLWFRRIIRRAHIEMEPGEQIPVPGKGENSWDCGEDAIYGFTTPARDVAAAIAAVCESALRDRARYGGGVNWVPKALGA
jgi:hypothetical protein